MPKEISFTADAPHYIAPFEVVVHNKPNDCWVSLLGRVLNLTPLLKKFEGQNCIKPLIALAGKDISNWFDPHTGDIQYYIHPVTSAHVPYCPNGRLPHVEPQYPTAEWKPLTDKPWWKDKKFEVGLLTKRVQPVRIINILICKEVILDICCEDTIYRVMERYSMFNSDPDSYVWICNDRNLELDKTLEENGVHDERDECVRLGLPASSCVPTIFLYYKDDFKWESED